MHLRQDRMSSKERMDALFSDQKPDRVPIMAWGSPFGALHAGYSVTEAFEDPEKTFNASLWTWELYGWEPVGFILGPGCTLPNAPPPVNMFAMTRAVNDFGWYD